MPTHRSDKRSPHKMERITLQLTERDLVILMAILHHQFMTIEMVATLFFSERGYTAAANRLAKLWRAGLVRRRQIPVVVGSAPLIYMPSPAGINALVEFQFLTLEEVQWRSKHNRVSAMRMRHELAVNELVIGLKMALAREYGLWQEERWPHRDGGMQMVRRIDMLALSQVCHDERGAQLWDSVQNSDLKDRHRNPSLPVRPDRLLVIKLGEQWHNLFVEVERTPKRRTRLKQRIRAYRIYYQSGGFLRRYGEGSDPAQYPFIVLFTVPSAERRNNLIEIALQEKTHRLCWFGVHREVLAHPLGRVWLNGEEYHRALGLLSEQERRAMYQSHRRGKRDRFIEQHAVKQSLMEDRTGDSCHAR